MELVPMEVEAHLLYSFDFGFVARVSKAGPSRHPSFIAKGILGCSSTPKNGEKIPPYQLSSLNGLA